MRREDLSSDDLKHLETLLDFAEREFDIGRCSGEDTALRDAIMAIGPLVRPDFDYAAFLGEGEDLEEGA